MGQGGNTMQDGFLAVYYPVAVSLIEEAIVIGQLEIGED